MGQKVNPISMRLQVNKDWSSRWFAGKRSYARYLESDLKVRRLIQNKLGSRAAINRVEISRTPNLVTVTIHTAKAGVVIGRGGTGAQELKDNIEKIYSTQTRVNIEEVKKPELFAKLVAENIAHQLERRMSFIATHYSSRSRDDHYATPTLYYRYLLSFSVSSSAGLAKTYDFGNL